MNTASGIAPSHTGLGGEALPPPLIFCARHSQVKISGWIKMLFLVLEAPVLQIHKVEMGEHMVGTKPTYSQNAGDLTRFSIEVGRETSLTPALYPFSPCN